MAPAPAYVWVVCETTKSGDITPLEAHMSDAAAMEAHHDHSIAEIKKIPLIKGGASKAKTTKQNAKGALTESEEEDELASDTHASYKQQAKPITPLLGGIPGVLKGLTVLFTGTMDENRKTCDATATHYGAVIARKIEEADYVIQGKRPGPAKVKDIKKFGLDTLSENEFFDMLFIGVPKDKRDRVAAKVAARALQAEDVEPAKKKLKSK